MKYKDYLKNNLTSILIYLSTILLLSLIFCAFKINTYLIIMCICLLIISGFIIITYNFVRKNAFYKNYLNNLDKLTEKYLILETIKEPTTYEEKLMVNSLYDINKSMIEAINEYKRNTTEFKEFVEIWIHEVKIPISSMVLKCHNHKNKYDKELLSLIRRLDNSIDEILYYVRSENTEKDFVISDVNLNEVIRDISIKNKDDLLENNIDFSVSINSNKVNTDKKWLEFIINQIINNSIKYKKDENSIIKISSYYKDDKTVLEMYDNGIGIPSKDVKRVFDKSFTGSNGRNKVKSTGMGLYIVKKLCDKLGYNILIESTEGEYTKVIIEFGSNEIYKF